MKCKNPRRVSKRVSGRILESARVIETHLITCNRKYTDDFSQNTETIKRERVVFQVALSLLSAYFRTFRRFCGRKNARKRQNLVEVNQCSFAIGSFAWFSRHNFRTTLRKSPVIKSSPCCLEPVNIAIFCLFVARC